MEQDCGSLWSGRDKRSIKSYSNRNILPEQKCVTRLNKDLAKEIIEYCIVENFIPAALAVGL